MTKLFIILLVIAGTSSCEKQAGKEQEDPRDLAPFEMELTAHAAEVIARVNDFGIRLFAEAVKGETDNMMLSPLSAGTALTMLLYGCEGATYQQIRDMLGYDENMGREEINASYQLLTRQLLAADPNVKLALANAIFYRKDFQAKPPFLNAMQTSFDAKVQSLDFDDPSAPGVINKWASDNTGGKIPKVLDRIEPQMVMFIMNALYFKGDWAHPFDEKNTSLQPFYLDNGQVAQVPTMSGQSMARFTTENAYTAVELSYGRDNFSMVIVVPETTLEEFYSNFSPGLWAHITSALDRQENPARVFLSLPRFAFEYETFLDGVLKTLGMLDAFNPQTADLSGISDDDIYVDFVKQNTFIEVNEQGTEAAAVTNVGVGAVSMPPMIEVDQPFIFAIRERTTNTLLFIGNVTDPLN